MRAISEQSCISIFFTQCLPLRLLHASGHHMSCPLFFVSYVSHLHLYLHLYLNLYLRLYFYWLSLLLFLVCYSRQVIICPARQYNSVAIDSFLWLFRPFKEGGIKKKYATTKNILTNLASNLLFFLVCYLCQVLICPGGKGEDTSVGSRAARRPVSVTQGCQGERRRRRRF